MQHSEIRDSTKSALLDKVRKHSYGKYLLKASIGKIRGFSGEDITFDFPVTALIGPNGSGKSSILGAAGCAYKSAKLKPSTFFPKSAIGDDSMAGWRVEYELIDKDINQRQTVKRSSNFRQAKWVRGEVASRDVLFFGIERTVPAGEKAKYKKLMRSTYNHTGTFEALDSCVSQQVEHVLGKSIDSFRKTSLGSKGSEDIFFVGSNAGDQYSEFHFGAGESSIIRMITEIEQAPENSLILIEEIENGLHPVATKRMVEYLIDAAERKSLQAIFTTHSDYALSPLPSEAIWACISGKLRQGRLSVEALRAVAGRVDRELAIFVEDEFSRAWVDSILREKLGINYEQIEVHAVAGDGNAASTHKSHMLNPSIQSKSLCIIDGDSKQSENNIQNILRLPGEQPGRTVYQSVVETIEDDLAIITVSCQRGPEAQDHVKAAIDEISRTNRDPHLLFNQLGMRIGFVPEQIVRGAFLAHWIRRNSEFCDNLAQTVLGLLREVDKAA